MELVNKPPPKLKELEEKLKNNPAMQAELERIAEAALRMPSRTSPTPRKTSSNSPKPSSNRCPKIPIPFPWSPNPSNSPKPRRPWRRK